MRIDCNKVRRKLLEEPAIQIQDEFLVHLAECPACARYAERLRAVDRHLAVEIDVSAVAAQSRWTWTRGKILALSGALAASALWGATIGLRFGADRLFAQAFASDLANPIVGPANMGFDEAELGVEGWSVNQFQNPSPGSPNFYALDSWTTRKGNGRSLKLLLRKWGGSVRRVLRGPFPAGTIVKTQAWVLMPNPGSTENKWLSFGLETLPLAGRASVSTIEVFDASPHWRPYILTTTLATYVESIAIGFSTSTGNGEYIGWDRAAWIDDVEASIVIPIVSEVQTARNGLEVRLAAPSGYVLSDDPKDLRLWTYGGRLPLLPPVSIRRDGDHIVCRYEANGLVDTVRGGNPDTGKAGLPIEIRVRLVGQTLTCSGSTSGLYAFPSQIVSP